MRKLDEFALDVETTGLRVKVAGNDTLVGIAFSWGKNDNYYVPIGHVEYPHLCTSVKKFVKLFKPILENPDVRLIAHNAMMEYHVLANIGIYPITRYVYDTMTAVWMINENLLKNLEDSVKHYYGYDKFHFNDIITTIPSDLKKAYGYKPNETKNVPCSLCEIPILGLYCMDDTYWAWKFYLDTQDVIEEEEMEDHFYRRYVEFFYTIFNMERRGVKIDRKKLEDMRDRAQIELEKLEYQIYEIAGIEFNISSDPQIQELLFGYKKFAPVYEQIKVYEFDAEGNPLYYKSGKNKGEQKFSLKSNKGNIVGEKFVGNQHILDASYNFPVKNKTDSGAPSVDKEALESILNDEYKKDKHKQEGQELVKLLLRYSKLSTRKGTFFDGLLEKLYQDGRMHTSYNITGTTSGRLSSNDPNLQNLPRVTDKVDKPIREAYASDLAYQKAVDEYEDYLFFINFDVRDCIIPDSEDDVIQVHDYTNLEAMLQAEYSEDELLIQMFEEGSDVHGYTAVHVAKLDCTANECKKKYPKMRQLYKSVRFLLQYGGTEFALMRKTGTSKEEARKAIDDYYLTFKGEAEYKVRQKNFAHKHGFVYSLMGRKRHLEGINSSNRKVSSYFERLALNYPNQGGAADVIMEAQILIEQNQRLKELNYRQLLQIHDEVVGVVPRNNVEESIAIVKDIMENCVKLRRVKLIADGDYSAECYSQAK